MQRSAPHLTTIGATPTWRAARLAGLAGLVLTGAALLPWPHSPAAAESPYAPRSTEPGLARRAATVAAASPYDRWPHGPSPDPSYFPIGVWLQNPDRAERYAAMGVNLYIGLWQGPTEAQLARLTEAGMRVICTQNAVGLRHRDDPIIAGWLQPDEPDNVPSTPRHEVRAEYERLVANDPTRPVLLNLGQGVANPSFNGRGVGYSAYPVYVQGADIVSFDVYPVAGVADPRSLWYVARGVDSLRTWTQDRKPVWNVIETTRINSAWRKATPRQVRAMVWMSLIHGSRGIIYFAHEWKPVFDEDRLLADDEMRTAVTAINRRIHDLAPVLNSPTVSGRVEVTTTDPAVPVDVLVKAHDGALWLFAASMREGRTTATFRVSGLPRSATATVLDESRRVSLSEGVFDDAFAQFEVHLYRVAVPKPTAVLDAGGAGSAGDASATGGAGAAGGSGSGDGAGPAGATPAAVALAPAFPNPFNGATTLRYTLPAATGVELAVYDLAGQRLARLVSGVQAVGVHQVRWDGRTDVGAAASGLYLVRLQAAETVRTRRVILLR